MVGQSLERKLDLFCTDPPYNDSSVQNRSNSNNDFFTKTYMDMFHLVCEVMKRGVHYHVFCSKLQFDSWYSQLRKLTGKVTVPGDVEDDEDVTMEVAMFELERVALKYTSEPGQNTGNPSHTI